MAALTEEALAADIRRELLGNILPFWRLRTVDERHGGFIAEMSNDLQVSEAAAKGLILNARILWAFAAASRRLGQPEDRRLARRACDYLEQHLFDPEYGGYFWELEPDHRVRDDKKKIYGQAFCLYALSEYHLAFGEPQALHRAIDGFTRIEAGSHDPRNGGYLEVVNRDWTPCPDMRLSHKDMNAAKSMNNHLHLLEGYTNLYRVWPDATLALRLRELIDLFANRILNADQTHFQHFFDIYWRPLSDTYTFGHDIEGSWLLCEAAKVLGDERLLADVRATAVRLARAVLSEGLDHDGGLLYEGRDGQIIDANKEWWPQSEAVVGFYNAWQLTGEPPFREAAARCWQFIQDKIVDHRYGEWFWRVSRTGVPDLSMPKVSIWKCPYHNGRCCLEMLERLETHPA
ncbi:MAG: AGE family epimerase/isomerase [Phycisphaerae bacterium]|nr:AGE family epimerase/isomerase [Phycisphaerae bacterium]